MNHKINTTLGTILLLAVFFGVTLLIKNADEKVDLSYSFSLGSQTAQVVSSLSNGLIGPYTYSGTPINLGSGAAIANLQNQGNGGMSVAFWITASSSASGPIITKGMGANNNGNWTINRGTNTVPNRIIFIKEGAVDLASMRNNAIPIGTRTHFVITFDGSMLRSGVKIYTNGSLFPDSGGGADGSGPNSDAANSLIIGGGPSLANFDGTLEDVRFYNRILTASEIAELSGSAAAPATTNPTPVVPPPVTGVTAVNGIYSVNAAGGTNVFTTIQACANVVTAGQTCLMQAGTYPERVIVKNAGSPGNPITFKTSGNVVMQGFDATNKGYLVIDGFEVTGTAVNITGINLNGAPGSKILNNYIHNTTGNAHGIGLTLSDNTEIANNRVQYTSGVGIRLNGNAGSTSKNVHIHDNTISWCGYLGNNKMVACQGMQPSGSNILVENNDFSHVLDFITYGNTDHLVIRNNSFHDVLASDSDAVPHIDGVQGWGNYVLVEGNKMYNVHEVQGNAHFALFANDWAPRHGLPDSADATIRYNTVTGIDSAFTIVQYDFKRARIYNNTVVSINAKANGVPSAFTQASTDGKELNNLFSDAVGPTRLSNYYFYPAAFPGADVDYNLSWKSSCGTTCGVWNLSSTYPSPPGSETHALYNKDPQIQAAGVASFPLKINSPAIDRGGPLTRVSAGDSGSGTNVSVTDAGMFQDGWAGISPDWIAVGSPTNAAQIATIDYTANIIRLRTPLSRKAGDPVWLFKDSNGTQVLYGNAPDIGAYESAYSDASVTTPPITPTTNPTPTPAQQQPAATLPPAVVGTPTPTPAPTPAVIAQKVNATPTPFPTATPKVTTVVMSTTKTTISTQTKKPTTVTNSISVQVGSQTVSSDGIATLTSTLTPSPTPTPFPDIDTSLINIKPATFWGSLWALIVGWFHWLIHMFRW